MKLNYHHDTVPILTGGDTSRRPTALNNAPYVLFRVHPVDIASTSTGLTDSVWRTAHIAADNAQAKQGEVPRATKHTDALSCACLRPGLHLGW